MIKRILVALDPDEDTPVATRYAAEMAHRHDATVSGLAVIDTRKITEEIGPGGAVGATYYADVSRRRMMEASRERAHELVQAFEASLNATSVRHGECVAEGVAVKQVVESMKYHDLLVIGNTSHFFYAHPDEQTNTLAKIVKRGLAPVLVVEEVHREVRRVLVAYDGSNASARTLQRFAQLRPFGTDVALELVHIRANDSQQDRTEAELLLHKAGDFLRAHGFERVVETSRNGGKPGVRLLEHANHTKADLIVAGAHAISAMRRLAFGSTTHALLRDGAVPLFLYH